jgi:phage baseplate assembly protein W
MSTPNPEKAFLGVGWSFPPCTQTDGRIETVAYEEDIRQAIRIILATDRGERVMRPDFGAGLNSFVFEPVSQTTMERVRTRVEESLIDWEPRIDVEEVAVVPGQVDRDRLVPDDGNSGVTVRNALLINITYRVRATNSVSNLVYPFYLQEGATR